MGFLFRKRIKIAPGINVNVSKSGTSVTVGGKGASVNIGKKGVYGNVGLPGTGIYAREKIVGVKHTKSKRERKQCDLPNYDLNSANTPVPPLTTEKSNEPTTKEALLGCSSVLVCFLLGVILAIKIDLALGLFITVAPILVMLVVKMTKSDNTNTR